MQIHTCACVQINGMLRDHNKEECTPISIRISGFLIAPLTTPFCNITKQPRLVIDGFSYPLLMMDCNLIMETLESRRGVNHPELLS